MRRPEAWRIVLSGLLISGAVAGTAFAYTEYAPPYPPMAGLRIDGVPLDGTSVESLVQTRAEALLSRKVRLVLEQDDGKPSLLLHEGTLESLGVRVERARTIDMARSLGQDLDPVRRKELAGRVARGEVDLPLFVRVEEPHVSAVFEALKEEHDLPPVPARLDLDRQRVVPETEGRYLDVYGTIAALRDRAAKSAGDPADPIVLRVPVAKIPPRVSSNYLKSLNISTVVASWETTFSRGGGQAGRARNVEVAASRLHGVVLSPGASFSFNEVVGARSEENGFKRAGEIFRGEMVDGVGGGTCQVASTLHAAAFFGGLDVVERAPHSRPSAYMQLGLDSTVVYPSVDLKLRNPYPFPVVISAQVRGDKLSLRLLGPERPVEVKFDHVIIGSAPYTRKITEDASVTKAVLKQKGIRGVTVRRTRTMIWKNGQRKVETSVDIYPPTTEIYRVPPGFDESELPELPDDPKATARGRGRQGEDEG